MNSGTATYRLTPIIIALLAAEFTSAFELTMIYAAVKSLIMAFGSPVNVGWIVTAYLLVAAAAAAICGRLGDMYGRRRLLLIVLALAAIGSAVSAFSSSLAGVIIGRALQGFSGAALPLCYGIVRETFPQQKAPFGIAIIGYALLIASTSGLVFGGLVVDNFGWRAIFIASAAMAVVSLVLCAVLLPKSPSNSLPRRLDLKGGLLFVPAIAGLLLAVSNLSTMPWTSPWVIGLFGFSLALMAVWVRHELRTEEPLIDLRLLTSRNIILANVAVALFAAGPLQGQVKLLLLQQSPETGIGLGLSATLASLVSLPSQLVALIVTPFAALAIGRIGARPIAVAGGALATTGCLILTLANSSIWMVGVAYVFVTLSSICMYASIPNIVVAETPDERTSEATGMQQVARSIGAAVGAQVIAALLTTSVVSDPVTGKGSFPSPEAFLLALSFLTAMGASVLIAALLILKPRSAARPANAAVLVEEPALR